MSKRKSNPPQNPVIPAENQWLRWGIPLLVFAVTFIVFLPALKNGFVNWDDDKNFLNNFLYRGLGWEQLKWMFTNARMGPYAPLNHVTFGLDYLVWGMNPSGYHFTSVALHSVTAVILYFLYLKLLTLSTDNDTRQGKIDLCLAAAFAALFFAVHPLRVESVTWLSDRHDILVCLFYMLALHWYIAPRSTSDAKITFWSGHILPLSAFLLALLSKAVAISLPLVLIILDIYPLRRLPLNPKQWFSLKNRHLWLEKVPYFVMSAVFGLIGYAAQAKAGALLSFPAFSFGSRIGTALFAAGFYVWKTIVPLNLIPLYQLPVGFGLISWQAILGGVFVLTTTIIVFILRRRWPAGQAVWAYYLVTLAPVAGFVKINTQAAADRYTYLSCLGFAVLVGAAFWVGRQASQKSIKSVALLVASLVIVVLGHLSWLQTQVWRDSETLWRHTLRVDNKLQCAYNNLGMSLALQGKHSLAMVYYQDALRINPGFAEAYNNSGTALLAIGKPTEAIEYFKKALHIKPDYPDAHYNLGCILSSQGKVNEALVHYREALRVKPDYSDAHYNLGRILASQGKLEEALLHYREVIRVSPGYAEAYNNIGVALLTLGKWEEAARYLNEALRIKSDYPDAHFNLALVLVSRGKLDEALLHYREAARLDHTAKNHSYLGLVLAEQGKLDEAILNYWEALRIDPDFAEAHNNLGVLLVKRGNTGEAVKHFKEAIRVSPNYTDARNNLAIMLKKQSATKN